LTIDSVPTVLKSLLHSQGDQRFVRSTLSLHLSTPGSAGALLWLRRHLRRRLVAQRIDCDVEVQIV